MITQGKDFIALIEAEWARERRRRGSDADEWVDIARKRAEGTWREEWWRRIPPPGKGKKAKEWKTFGDHYWLARYVSFALLEIIALFPHSGLPQRPDSRPSRLPQLFATHKPRPIPASIRRTRRSPSL